MKYREFWIQWIENGPLEPFWDVQSVKPHPSAEKKYRHMIEYAAYEKTLKELNEFKSQCAILIEKVNTITALVFELENRNKK